MIVAGARTGPSVHADNGAGGPTHLARLIHSQLGSRRQVGAALLQLLQYSSTTRCSRQYSQAVHRHMHLVSGDGARGSGARFRGAERAQVWEPTWSKSRAHGLCSTALNTRTSTWLALMLNAVQHSHTCMPQEQLPEETQNRGRLHCQPTGCAGLR